ncbi:hypothetical protein AB3R30_07550 [Leptolyngbyaceae cyanobacterium UHCC 1019]
MYIIYTGQQVIVHTGGVTIRGIVQQIQPNLWGEPCYLIRDQWYCQKVYPDPNNKPRSQWFLGKLYTEPSDPPVLLVKYEGEKFQQSYLVLKLTQPFDTLADGDSSLQGLSRLVEDLSEFNLRHLITVANGLLWSEETEKLVHQFVAQRLQPLIKKDIL